MGLSENKVPTESNGSLTFDLCMHEFGVSNIARQTHMYLCIYINNLCLQVFAFCMVFSVLKCSHVTPKYQERCVNEWSGLKNCEAPIVIIFCIFLWVCPQFGCRDTLQEHLLFDGKRTTFPAICPWDHCIVYRMCWAVSKKFDFHTGFEMIGCIYIYISGWWFQTVVIFHNICDNPSHWLIFFKMVIAPPTRYIL